MKSTINLQWIEIPQQHLQWIEIHNNTCNGLKSTAVILAVPMGLIRSFSQPRASGSVYIIRIDFNLSVIKNSEAAIRASGSADFILLIISSFFL
jgi:hypothetical protein